MIAGVRVPRCVAVVTCLLAAAATGAAEGPAGRWEGAIEIPGAALEVVVDLSRDGGAWSGTVDIPTQGAADLPLEEVTVEGAEVRFRIAGIPGEPAFDGSLDGDVLAGEFTQGGQPFPFRLQRAEAPADAAGEALAGLDAEIGRALADFGVPGLAVGVIVDGEVVLARGYGLRDVERELPVTADTLFAIGSATKAFTTFVLGQLVDEGLVEWDAPVRRYLPAFRMADEHATARLTVRDLVTHRSGLPRHDLSWYGGGAGRAELVARLEHLEPFADLRERYHYQNLMFLTAGYLVEQVTGRSWEENVRERVFGPLGMASSNFSVADSQLEDDFAQPYQVGDDGVPFRVPFRPLDEIGPAGSINSSVHDMLRWVAVHLDGGRVGGEQLVQPATLREMHTAQVVVGGYPEPDDEVLLSSYGLGWFVESYRGRYRVQHGGGIDGFITMVSFLPRERIGVVTLTNASGVSLSPLVNRVVLDRLLGETDRDRLGEALERRRRIMAEAEQAEEALAELRVEGTTPSHPLADYAGEYRHPGYGPLEIAEVDGGLRITYNRMTHPLGHRHYDVFKVPVDDEPGLGGLEVQFRSGFDGRVAEAVVPMEPEVEPIVFERQPDRRLRDPAYLERFTGTYELPGQTLRVFVRGDGLVVEVSGQPPYDLVPEGDARFGLEGVHGYSVEFVERDGEVVAARLIQPDGVYEAERARE